MEYRELGEYGVKVSEISLGSWLTYGNYVERDKAVQTIHKAYELGINSFDTANVYAQGEAEKVVGESVEAIQSTEDSFEDINQAAANLSELIDRISNSANKMAKNSREVSTAIEEIAAVSEEASSNAEEVAATSEEQSASTQEIVNAAEELASMAQQLSETVDKFEI